MNTTSACSTGGSGGLDDENTQRTVASLLRSVSLNHHSGNHRAFRLQPALLRRRAVSNEPDLLAKAIKADADDGNERLSVLAPLSCHDHASTSIEEEYLQEFLCWSSKLSLRMLPTVSPDFPLMPTSLTLHNVDLQTITKTIADCLHRMHEKNILFAYRAHPEHIGRIELCSTQCKLKFVIQLWQQQLQLQQQHQQQQKQSTAVVNDDDEDADEEDTAQTTAAVIVELQRRRGCPIFMHHLKRPLFIALGALTTKEQQSLLRKTASMPALLFRNNNNNNNATIAAAAAANLDTTSNHGGLLLPGRRGCLEHIMERPTRFPSSLRVNFS